jgi:hypothetical protein
MRGDLSRVQRTLSIMKNPIEYFGITNCRPPELTVLRLALATDLSPHLPVLCTADIPPFDSAPLYSLQSLEYETRQEVTRLLPACILIGCSRNGGRNDVAIRSHTF